MPWARLEVKAIDSHWYGALIGVQTSHYPTLHHIIHYTTLHFTTLHSSIFSIVDSSDALRPSLLKYCLLGWGDETPLLQYIGLATFMSYKWAKQIALNWLFYLGKEGLPHFLLAVWIQEISWETNFQQRCSADNRWGVFPFPEFFGTKCSLVQVGALLYHLWSILASDTWAVMQGKVAQAYPVSI